MSTRAQIAFYKNETTKIENAEVFISRHFDGYPETSRGVLHVLEPFCKHFKSAHGLSDISYAVARCLVWMIAETSHPNETMGYGLGKGGKNGVRGDIEYFYHVSPTKIQVFEVPFQETTNTSEWKKIHEIII